MKEHRNKIMEMLLNSGCPSEDIGGYIKSELHKNDVKWFIFWILTVIILIFGI